jgi:hypothetical protein
VQASGSVPAKPNQSAGKQPGPAEVGGQLDGIKVPTPWASGKIEAVQACDNGPLKVVFVM